MGEGAIAAEAAAIIFGDPHLLTLGAYRTIPIMTPAQFLEQTR